MRALRFAGLFAALLFLCLFSFATAQADIQLMVVTDLHYIDPVYYEGGEALRESAMYGDGKMPHYSDIWLQALRDEAIALAPDAVVLLGDQAYNGEVLSHRAVSDAMAEVMAEGIAVYAIPGNHDINNSNAFSYLPGGAQAVHSITYERYSKYYGEYGLTQAFSRDDGSYSYAIALSDSLWLIMIDAGIYEPLPEAFGLIREDTQAWVAGLLAEANAQGIQVITVTHQSLLPHSKVINQGYMVINWEDIVPLLAEGGVRLNLSGHLHVQHIAQHEGFYDAALSSLSNQPNQYALVTIRDDGSIEYRTQSLSPAHLPENTSGDAVAFFLFASHEKALAALRDYDLPGDTKQAMAAYAAEVNRHYYAGTVHTIREAALEDEMFALWQEQAPGIFWTNYLADMLVENPGNMSALSLPTFEAP